MNIKMKVCTKKYERRQKRISLPTPRATRIGYMVKPVTNSCGGTDMAGDKKEYHSTIFIFSLVHPIQN
jgi:hypothetical protein